MRGKQEQQITMLSALTPEQLVPQDHPIRRIKPIVDQALKELSLTFNRMYADVGRPSIPPEHLLKASLLIALYSIRSERQFCERLQYDLLFKWFLDFNIMDPAFDASSFSKNKTRLLEHRVVREFLTAVVAEARRQKLVSEDHFSVDGTLLEAWASLKSIHPKDGEPPQPGERNPDVDFRGQSRTNDTHCSNTDPETRLARKGTGKEAKLCFAGHVLMENRNGLVVDVKNPGELARARTGGPGGEAGRAVAPRVDDEGGVPRGGGSTMRMTTTVPEDLEARDRLVMQHVGLVKSLANRLAQRVPAQVEVAELISVGVLGLIDAAGRYKPSLGVPFDAFARRRIHGAMLDALRELDWAPRSVRKIRRDVDGTIDDGPGDSTSRPGGEPRRPSTPHAVPWSRGDLIAGNRGRRRRTGGRVTVGS